MIQDVTVDIPYTMETGEQLVNETFGPNNIRRRRSGAHELKQMTVRNGRLLADRLSLDEQGFVFVEHETKVVDFFDALQLESVYYPEVEELIKGASGAFLVAERRYPHRVGQTYRLKYNSNHRWFYFPEMRRDEALVFKVYDSEKDGRARFTPHTSFEDPASPPNAPPRQSIEVRAFAFF